MGTVNIDSNVPACRIFDIEREDEEFIEEFYRVIDDPNIPHAEDSNPEANLEPEIEMDNYVDMIVARRRNPEEPLEEARVKRRALDAEGYPIGKAHESGNPLLDSRRYEVVYADGETEVIAANILAENILGQVDENGFRDLMMDEIMDHRRNDDAVPKDKGTFIIPSGTTRQVQNIDKIPGDHWTYGW